jgi:ankyrin repeat protein
LTHSQAGLTALGLAASGGRVGVMETLIRRQADVNKGCPLVHASRSGQIDSVKLLLTHPDIDVDQSLPADGVTALMSAGDDLRQNLVEVLAADPRVIINHQDSLGRTALMRTFKYSNSVKGARILLEHGADMTMEDNKGKPCREYIRSEEMREFVERWEDEHSTDRYIK